MPGSLNIGLGGQFAIWAGSLIPMGTPIVIVAESEEKAHEAVMRLARVGHRKRQRIISPVELTRGKKRDLKLATVAANHCFRFKRIESQSRSRFKFWTCVVHRNMKAGMCLTPLLPRFMNLPQKISQLAFDPKLPTAVICAGGYRSSAATSILAAARVYQAAECYRRHERLDRRGISCRPCLRKLIHRLRRLHRIQERTRIAVMPRLS